MRMPPHDLGCFASRCGEAAPCQHRQVDYVVSHIATVQGFDSKRRRERRERGPLVVYALQNVRNAQIPRPVLDDAGSASGQNCNGYAARNEHPDSVSIQGAERLQFFAGVGVINSPIGEDAVYVEDHKAHVAGALERCIHLHDLCAKQVVHIQGTHERTVVIYHEKLIDLVAFH